MNIYCKEEDETILKDLKNCLFQGVVALSEITKYDLPGLLGGLT